MKEKQMYFWMVIADLITTAVLEAMADSGVKPEDFTKEMWEEASVANVARRKAAMDRIRSHGSKT